MSQATAQYRYTGKNLVIVFNGVHLEGDYVTFEANYQMKTVERTAGADTDESFNTTYKSGSGSIDIYDEGPQGVTVNTSVRVGAAGNLYAYSQGIGTGLPVESFPIIVTDMKHPLGFDKNTMLQISFVKNGPMINDVGSLQ